MNNSNHIYCTKMLPLPELYITNDRNQINTYITLESVADTDGQFHIGFYEQDGLQMVKIIINKREIPLAITRKYLEATFGEFKDSDIS